MVTLKDLVCSTYLMISLSILITSLFWTDNLCLAPIIISSVLATFELSLLAFSQQLSLLSSGIKACLSSVNVLADSVMFVSSVNILGVAARRKLGRSLI